MNPEEKPDLFPTNENQFTAADIDKVSAILSQGGFTAVTSVRTPFTMDRGSLAGKSKWSANLSYFGKPGVPG